MLREKTLGECILKVERAAANDFPDLLKSFPVDFPLRASPLDRFYDRLGQFYSLQQKKQGRNRMKCSEQYPGFKPRKTLPSESPLRDLEPRNSLPASAQTPRSFSAAGP